MKIEIDYFYGCAICKVDGVLLHKCNDKVKGYVLVGFNSTKEQDLFRLRTLKELGITPFVLPFRDYNNKREPSQYEKDLARWAN